MNANEIMKIFEDTAYIRTSGTEEERRCAEYIRSWVSSLGVRAELQPFAVPMANIHQAVLTVDGKDIPCKGYLCAGDHEVEAPFYYLRSTEPWSLSQSKGKIVLVDGYVGFWKYQDIMEAGAVGYISYNGNVRFPNQDIDQRELRSYFHKGQRLPGVNIHVTDAIELIRSGAKTAKIRLKQEEWEGQSQNVILDLPGQTEEFIALTAHYDTTALSVGAYDNMSGCVCLLALAEYFTGNPHRYGLRFIWCGSEERGLLGSKYYCSDEERVKNCVLDINIDMIGCIMGRFHSSVSAEENLCHYVSYLASELGYSLEVRHGIYSSDSTPFADKGVPAITFARSAPSDTATFHDRYDTMEVLSAEQMEKDIAFVQMFADRMANAKLCPVARTIPDNIREKLDVYLGRIRGK